jgi:DNA segregation ATPase FtsK/SpoIIIE, S-DNA-T family
MLRRELSPGRPAPRLRFGSPLVRLPLSLLALGWAAGRAGRALWWLARHPRTLALLTLAAGLVAIRLRWGWAPLAWPGAILVVVAGVWWARFPDSFRRQVTLRLLGRWRRFIYWRDWQPAMVTAGLAHAPAHGATLPRLRKVISTAEYDTLRVRMLPGQTVDTWRDAAPKLAQTWSLRAVRVGRDPRRVQDVLLTCRRRGVPASDIPAVTKPAPVLEEQPEPAARGAFPRQPRRAS